MQTVVIAICFYSCLQLWHPPNTGWQDWEELLEANIKAGYSASNTAHLNTIKLTSKNLEEILEQQVFFTLHYNCCAADS